MKKIIIVLGLLILSITVSSFTYLGWYKCKACDGKGYPYTRDCSRCHGKKEILIIVDCSRCNGNGYVRNEYGDQQRCPKCNGAKKESRNETCPSCNGRGDEPMACRKCNGKGEVWVDD